MKPLPGQQMPPGVSAQQQESIELVERIELIERIQKLRSIGMEDEAEQLQMQLLRTPPAGSVLATRHDDTD